MHCGSFLLHSFWSVVCLCGEPRCYIHGVIPFLLQNPWEEAVDVSSSPCFLSLLMAAWAAWYPHQWQSSWPAWPALQQKEWAALAFQAPQRPAASGSHLPSSLYRPDMRWTDGEGVGQRRWGVSTEQPAPRVPGQPAPLSTACLHARRVDRAR